MLSYASLRAGLKRLARILLILLLVIVVIIISGIAFVVIRRHQALVLPAPTRSYPVGRMEDDWPDQSRNDLFAPHAGTKRDLVFSPSYPPSTSPARPSAP